MKHEKVLILDFGSQYTRLIARRVRELSVYCEILPPDTPASVLRDAGPRGIILSGGPGSVFENGPEADPDLLRMETPILGICYGMQYMVQQLGGRVEAGGRREYGQATLSVTSRGESGLLEGLEPEEQVWMSHGDFTSSLPEGFVELGRCGQVPFSAVEDTSRGLYGLQFHPEVGHTKRGRVILGNFLHRICGCTGDWTMSSFLDETIERIRLQVGDRGKVLCGISGGVDSSVAAQVIHRAIGDRVICLFVDTGLLRKSERAEILDRFRRSFGLEVRAVDASSRFLEALGGVVDPEQKRRIVGELFVRVFEEEARAVSSGGAVRYLGQGTLYPDLIESRAVNGPSATIKTHHNVGGLPERMDLEVVEPLRELFKDEVRSLGQRMGMDDDLLGRHPFPGPGLAVRILGEVTAERVRLLQEADAIFIDEIRRAGLYDRIGQAFAVFLPIKSVGVMGDSRTYENVLALRAVDTRDFMTADWSRLPYDLLARASTRIVNEVRGINRVVYDISSKPPGTIEWE